MDDEKQVEHKFEEIEDAFDKLFVQTNFVEDLLEDIIDMLQQAKESNIT